jgi:hypothetical protein
LASDALRNLCHALFVEGARPEKEVRQHGPPAHDHASHHPGSAVEQAYSRVDEAESWPYDCVAEQIGASLVDGLDLPGHVVHKLSFVPASDD